MSELGLFLDGGAAAWCRSSKNAMSRHSGRSFSSSSANQRLITKNLQLTAELTRLRKLPEVAQLTFAVEQTLQQTRTAILGGAAWARAAGPRAPRATGLTDCRGAARAAG